jgi:hypothetical protein
MASVSIASDLCESRKELFIQRAIIFQHQNEGCISPDLARCPHRIVASVDKEQFDGNRLRIGPPELHQDVVGWEMFRNGPSDR